jgi:UV DNA damage repair endonuclease
LKDKKYFIEIVFGSALQCATIHDVLAVCDAMDDESDGDCTTTLKRIVSTWTRRIQQTISVSGISIEYAYHSAEYEYKKL